MKNIILFATFIIIGLNFSAQESFTPDQNPNYQNSLDRFKDSANDYSVLQGTTLQKTYKAIDPLKVKRELKALRRKHRANRPVWRHEERMARINNTTYIDSDYGYNNGFGNYGYSNSYRNSSFNRGYRNSFTNSNSLLSLGLLGCVLWN
ncbi:MAG: hypothetical protein ACI8XB_002729 [Patiriisocius sp.]|jgi:hypothetical protein